MITHGRTVLASCITAAGMGAAIYGASIALEMYLFPGILFAG
jgi:hypothetical protein